MIIEVLFWISIILPYSKAISTLVQVKSPTLIIGITHPFGRSPGADAQLKIKQQSE